MSEEIIKQPKKRQELDASGNRIPFYKTKVFGDRVFAYCMSILPIIEFFIFFVYLNIDTIVLTFQNQPEPGKYEWCGFENYERLFRSYILGENKAHLQTILNSFIPLTLTVIAFPISFVCAYAFYKHIQCEKFFRIVFYLPSLISASVLAMSFRYMFHYEFGPINFLLGEFGGGKIEFFTDESTYLWPMMYLYGLFSGLGGNVIIMTAAMNRIPTEVTESALLDGVSFWGESIKITLPLCLPTLYAFIINIPIGIFGFVMTPLFIAQTPGFENKFYTIGWKLYDCVQNQAITEGATLGLMLSVLWAPVIYGTRAFINKVTPKDIDY